MADLRNALLIIRAWVERGSAKPLRARVRVSNDVSNGFDKTTTVTTPAEGGAMVKDWLEELVADAKADDEAALPKRA
jgi:hypothetical protein